MAVYTQVDDGALEAFLAEYEIGMPRSFKGIAEGVENSNYYLETDQDRFILTLFEKRVDAADLPYFISLKQHLAAKAFPCPRPIPGRDGAALRELCGRPAVIVSFLDGLSPRQPSRPQCRELGAGLARMHLALEDFAMTRANSLGPASFQGLWSGRAKTADELETGLASEIEADLKDIISARTLSAHLPRGTIHADLFPDNAFFLDESFSGIIDFYFACTDALAYDLAICLNAWAFDDAQRASGLQYSYSHGAALISGYDAVRPLSDAERAALPLLCRTAAMRFFLTRLVDWSDTPPDALVKPKNPLEYAQRLRFHRHATGPADYGA
ncbi:MAG: homoserine kinase [Hyphomonadaceae bacterium]|nr:homoserine kinase [Hyphomonadaceae bacterium]